MNIEATPKPPHAALGRTQAALQLQTMNLGRMSLDVVQIGDEPWFYAPSLARTLEYRDASNFLRSLADDEKGTYLICTPGGPQQANLINEWGLYRVVTRSNSAVAEPFKRWVFREVLPSIRKTGQYQMHQEALDLGISFNFTKAQWDWLKLHPYLVDLLPLAAAGYNSVEISRMLGYNTPTGITARKQIDKLKELGFLPQVIEPRLKQLERRIKTERGEQAALPAP